MISVDDALEKILADINPVDTETVAINDADGRVLAEDIVARRTQPPTAVSAMDGYAVKISENAANGPARFRVVGEAPAGGAYEDKVSEGEAVRIFTGGPLPVGTDSIIIQEDVKTQGRDIEIDTLPPRGTYVRPAGLDFSKGDIGIKAGKRLTSRDIGLAAAMDHPWILVRRKPRIALLATGDELVRPGEPVGDNQIISSNSLLVGAMVKASGGEAIDLGIARDNEDSLRAMASSIHSADMLVTLGGASVGDHDLVQSVLGKEGLEIDFWRIAMRPGKPLMFGKIKDIPMLGMPGNPVSSMVCSYIFLIPALARLCGLPRTKPAVLKGVLATDLGENDQRQDYLRARITKNNTDLPEVAAFGKQDSSMLSSLAGSDCFIVRAPFDEARRKGDVVDILKLAHEYPSL